MRSHSIHFIIALTLIFLIGLTVGYTVGYYKAMQKTFPSLQLIEDINSKTAK